MLLWGVALLAIGLIAWWLENYLPLWWPWVVIIAGVGFLWAWHDLPEIIRRWREPA